MTKRTKAIIDDIIQHTAPPGIVLEPVLDGDEDREFLDNFHDTLICAVVDDIEDNDPSLLDALRAKWSDDVERELPAIRRGVTAELKQLKAEAEKSRVA